MAALLKMYSDPACTNEILTDVNGLWADDAGQVYDGSEIIVDRYLKNEGSYSIPNLSIAEVSDVRGYVTLSKGDGIWANTSLIGLLEAGAISHIQFRIVVPGGVEDGADVTFKYRVYNY